jgi:hypothetical protein
MNDLQKLQPVAMKYLGILYRKQVFIVLILCSAILIYSLLVSRSYLNPTRDEDHYQEASLSVNYATIDQSELDELSATINDKDIEVDSNFEPGRNNPFGE